MKRILAAAAAALAVTCMAGVANAQPTYLPSWNMAEMKSVVTGMGMTVTEEETNDAGDPIVTAKSKNGFNFTIYGTACKGEKTARRCDGANLSAFIDYDTKAEADAVFKQVDYAAIKYWMSDDDSIAVSRYVIFDNGIHRKNLEVNIEVFIELAEGIWQL